ncbi:MAG: hypothetical protein KFB96_17800 [Thiocapsa sp.]|uniref:hypothetical protein n=1 Tax=Thiocapsa sp. TaxID=2024551 RepID=UPI001BCD0A51|nr:hypothetical protein [Thiocapsa sp.]QVL47540.1 MAG: hypothetical protein KFB96_17800 [Thiocapsa sp.]
MQLRFECHLTGADYVIQQAWLDASLPRCPLHPQGGCHFARHGTYARVSPPGTRVARWYCPEGHRTFSLLPDCLAARLSGTLAEVEAVVSAAEQAPSLEALCKQHRLDIELPGALRWVRRRVQDVHSALHRIKGILGEPFALVEPTLTAFADHLEVEQVLVALRGIAAAWLDALPKPLGFAPRRHPGGGALPRVQHRAGPDPPGCQA